MNKIFAALLILGLLVSAGATVASAAQSTQSNDTTWVGGNG